MEHAEEMSRRISALSRFSQAGQIFVSHPADPLVDVVEVDQEELSVAFQLLLMTFGFSLKMNRNGQWPVCSHE